MGEEEKERKEGKGEKEIKEKGDGREGLNKKMWKYCARDETLSGIKLKEFYGPEDVNNKKLENPGEYPYTRGIHKNMYRGKLWTIRQFSGFGTARDTNERWKFLIKEGQTGLSTAFDMPTLMGIDSDDRLALGEVGVEGVAIDNMEDFEELFDGINLGDVSVSFTINAPAIVIYSMYLLLAERQGVPYDKLRATFQTDIFKEFHAQNEWVFPPEPSLKIVVDMIEFSAKHTPKINIISVSGYHIREAGANAIQEAAFTLADGFAYVEACCERGMNVDDFAGQISFFFNSHIDFFEEIAKFRAARRIWATEMKERFGAKNPKSMWMRFHTQTAGCSLTAQQPEVNIIRTTIEAMAAVLGGTQSLHTNSFDEALCLPSNLAARIALRTQQVIAYEANIGAVADPFGGSYFMEKLTDIMEEKIREYLKEILKIGNGSYLKGVIEGIKSGYFRKEIAKSAYEFQKKVEKREFIWVGVNEFLEEEEKFPTPIFRVPQIEEEKIKKLKEYRKRREINMKEKWLNSLQNLNKAVKNGENLVPYVMDALRNGATEGEIMEVLRKNYGTYSELKNI